MNHVGLHKPGPAYEKAELNTAISGSIEGLYSRTTLKMHIRRKNHEPGKKKNKRNYL